ncbi:hypothetical protein OJAV_G00016750 [Oryzias javanicus]|uniref:Immunoglobulin V-set domain-containing protein n=1 Tax=Oryzias javanicus TaxID=123683 RepID=A0A3S2MVK5_ORYJA|nr:hypothetical protein OJAV_G00016750 [Oryzias javanicus]
MVSTGGQNVMKVRAELGKDISLNCSIRNKDIFWFVQIYDDCRSFFCAEKKDHSYIFLDSFLLDSGVCISPPTNTSVHDVQEVRGQAAIIYHGVLVGLQLLSLVAEAEGQPTAGWSSSVHLKLQTEAAAFRGRQSEPSSFSHPRVLHVHP